jgi:ABC-type polysaccharide/polyol phosphate export permease
MLDRFHRLARNRQTFIVLLVAAVGFFFLGNIGGTNGNPSWLLAPLCLLLMIALGVDASIQMRRKPRDRR